MSMALWELPQRGEGGAFCNPNILPRGYRPGTRGHFLKSFRLPYLETKHISVDLLTVSAVVCCLVLFCTWEWPRTVQILDCKQAPLSRHWSRVASALAVSPRSPRTLRFRARYTINRGKGGLLADYVDTTQALCLDSHLLSHQMLIPMTALNTGLKLG